MGLFLRHYYKLYKNEQKNAKDKMLETVQTLITNANQAVLTKMEENQEESKLGREELNNKIFALNDNLGTLKKGLLTLHGKEFKSECRELLDPDHIITYEEFESILREHTVYNSLGGNSDGDELFKLVEKKYQSSIIK